MSKLSDDGLDRLYSLWTDPLLAKIEALQAEADAAKRDAERMREALAKAISHADAIARSEGMPPDKCATRLTLFEVNEHGAFWSEWDVAEARAALSGKEST